MVTAEFHLEQVILVISTRYQNSYPGFPGTVIHHRRQKITLNLITKTLVNFMSPFVIEI